MENHSFLRYLHPEDVARFTTELYKNPQDGAAILLELRLLHSSGRTVPVLLRGTASTDVHGTRLVCCVLMDITEQHELIERLEVEKIQCRRPATGSGNFPDFQ